MSDQDDASISIPSLLIGGIFVYLIYRYFLSSSSGSRSSTAPRRRGVDPAHVEQIAQMFPQLSRRDIMWDMQRNGGSVQSTTERVLTGRGLDPAPQSFQPVLPPMPSQDSSSASRSTGSASAKAAPSDLISRYNLSARLADESTEPAPGTPSSKGWSTSKTERQTLLQKRRDEMILAARRKMMEKDKAASGGAATPGSS